VLAFYADESGSFDPHDPGQPWVVFLAVGFDDDHWLTIHRAFTELKLAYFPNRLPSEIEIRSNDLRTALVYPRARNAFSSLGAQALCRFGNDLYRMIDTLPFAWCGVAIDKAFAREHLNVHDGHALFALAYRATVERLHGWCAQDDRVGRFFVDQRDRNLDGRVHRESPSSTKASADWTVHAQRTCRIVERPYFQDSRRSHHLQLADLIAYNVLRRFRENDPAYPYFSRILPKLRARDGLIVYGPKRPENDVPG
jgi:Protein of unknown function (DUF3800)